MAEGQKKAAALVAAENDAAQKRVAADKVAESKAEGMRIAAAVNAQKAAEVEAEASSAAPPAVSVSVNGKQQEDASSVLARMKAMEQGGSGVAEVKPTVVESSAAPPPAAAESKGDESKSVSGEGDKEQEGMGLRAKIDEWAGKGRVQSQPPKKAAVPARRVVEESSAAKAADELMAASSAAAQKAQDEKDAALAKAAREREEAARRKDEELAGKIAQIEKVNSYCSST